MIRVLEDELSDPSDDEEDAASVDTQTTESRTSVAVPLEQALAVTLSVLSDESFRKKLYCVGVTVKLVILLPPMFKTLRFAMSKMTDGNSVNLLFDRSNVVTDGSAMSKVAIELSVRFSEVNPCRA